MRLRRLGDGLRCRGLRLSDRARRREPLRDRPLPPPPPRPATSMLMATIFPLPVVGGSRSKVTRTPRLSPSVFTSSRSSRSRMLSVCRNASGLPLLMDTKPYCFSTFHVLTTPDSLFGIEGGKRGSSTLRAQLAPRSPCPAPAWGIADGEGARPPRGGL